MRIISGTNRGRIIIAPADLPVRPTTDFAKESLFNVLRNYIDIESADVLDLFSGTGNISFELASRDCKNIISVDINPKCTRFISQMADKLNFNNLKVIQSDYSLFIERANKRWDFIFADPPYEMDGIKKIPQKIFDKNILKESGLLVIEHPKEISFFDDPGFTEQRTYGRVNFSYFRNT
jgi:16S rRNA (guanine(966)-N(2))-methyltransferase RsmD